MRKIDIVNNALGAAQAILNGGNDVNTLVVWCEALNRYVLYQQRTAAQFLENVYQSLEQNPPRDQVVKLITDFIAELTKEKATLTDLNASIEWEPIFDRD